MNPLVEAKCPNCGANLEIDKNLQEAVCSHCGTPFIVQKAITQNNIVNNVTNNINAETVNIGHQEDFQKFVFSFVDVDEYNALTQYDNVEIYIDNKKSGVVQFQKKFEIVLDVNKPNRIKIVRYKSGATFIKEFYIGVGGESTSNNIAIFVKDEKYEIEVSYPSEFEYKDYSSTLEEIYKRNQEKNEVKQDETKDNTLTKKLITAGCFVLAIIIFVLVFIFRKG